MIKRFLAVVAQFFATKEQILKCVTLDVARQTPANIYFEQKGKQVDSHVEMSVDRVFPDGRRF